MQEKYLRIVTGSFVQSPRMTPSLNVIKAMDSFKVGALMVIDQSEKLVGIITERDYTRKVVLKERS